MPRINWPAYGWQLAVVTIMAIAITGNQSAQNIAFVTAWALVVLSLPAVFASDRILKAAAQNAHCRGAAPGLRLLAWSTVMLIAALGWIAPAILLFISTFVVYARMDNVRNQEDLDARKDR